MLRHENPARKAAGLALSAALLVGLSACIDLSPGESPNFWLYATQTTSPAPSITLAQLGDVMLGRGVRPTPNTFAYLSPELQAADLALANLESPLTSAASRTNPAYALCAAPENAVLLSAAGFDLLSLANNHHLDCGAGGLADTQSALAKAGLDYVGPAPEPVIRQVKGLRLAFLAFDATADFALEEAAGAVAAAQKTGAVVIVALHWGNEYQSGASTRQQQIASRLAEAGAALIWGHHPHVLQPTARVGTSLVLYSLGNAIFDQGGLASTRQSALVVVKLDGKGVCGMRVVPFVIDVPNSRVAPPDPETAAVIMEYFNP